MEFLLLNYNSFKIILVVVFLISNFLLFSIDIDSLKKELESADNVKKIELLNQLARHYSNKDSKRSVGYAQNALELAKQLGIIKGQLDANFVLADNYFKNGNIDESINISIRSIQLATDIESEYHIAKFSNSLGSVNRYRGEYDKALKYYFNSLRIWESIGNEKGKIKQLRNIGDVYKYKGEYDKSITFLFDALKLSESNGTKLETSDINSVIGQVFYYLKNYEDALKFHKEALTVAIKLNERQSIAICYSNIGMVYLAENMLKEATESYKKALIIDIEIGDKIGENIEYSNLAIIYSKQKDFKNSLKYNKLSLALERQSKNNIGIAQSLNNIGKDYLIIGRLDKSLKVTLEAYNLVKNENSPEVLYNICSELAQIYFMKQNYEKGNHFISRFVTIKDSLFNNKMSKQVSEIRTKYELEKKEKQIFSLIRDTEINKLEIDKQKLIKNIFIWAFISVTILLVTIYCFYSFKVKSNKKINAEKMKALLEIEKRVTIEKALRQSQIEIKGLNENLKNEISIKENELDDTTDKLKESEKILIRQEKLVSLGTMLAGIAHEIKNPAQAISFSLDGLSLNINDIKSFIEETLKLSKNDSFSGEDKLRVILGLIKQYELPDIFNEVDSFVAENKKTVAMIENIVNSAKKLSYSNLSFSTFSINDIIIDSLNLVNNQIKYTAMIDLRLGENLPKVTGSYQELGQVFINLLINAKDAIVDKKIESKDAEIKIETSFVEQVSKVLVKITDNGIGIESENLAKVYEPFFTTKKISSGTGLGLNIVKRIIESHHGQIEFKSTINEGTVFYIYLPV